MNKLLINPKGPIFKKDEEIICLENAGATCQLTIGRVYKVIEFQKNYGADEVIFMGNQSVTNAFSSRFTTVKFERRKKLKKIYEKS